MTNSAAGIPAADDAAPMFLRLEPRLKRRLARFAFERNLYQVRIVREALERYLDEQEGKEKPAS